MKVGVLKKGEITVKKKAEPTVASIETESIKVTLPIEVLKNISKFRKENLVLDTCASLKTTYDETPKWIAQVDITIGINDRTGELERDIHVGALVPNGEAEQILTIAKMLKCKWAEDEEFPPPD